jgi:GrpB-like predicted nucleotidyltransferase (UPF0157 family)/ribosomal protein S18 acetylase RimI-like enzyme
MVAYLLSVSDEPREELRSAVGDEPVRIVAYDQGWPERFEQERTLLSAALGDAVVGGIHHVGSTSVPGLASKPVIDILVGVRGLQESRSCFERLGALGYLYAPYRSAEMHWFCKPDPLRRTHHLHLVPIDSARFRDELAFRDRLRADGALAREYEALKHELAARHREDREAYTQAKSEFVRRHTTPLLAVRHVLVAEYSRLREVRLNALATNPEAFGSTHEADAAQPPEWWRRWSAASEQGSRERTFILVDDEDRWLGMAFTRFGAEKSDVAWVGGMWIAPEARGGGASRLLCRACIRWATERGGEELVLTVVAGNDVALRAYQAAGFAISERRTHSYGARALDEFIMTRSLGATSADVGRS